MILDVCRTSSSRLDQLVASTEDIIRGGFLKFNGHLRQILHEDFVNKDESKKIMNWATNSNYFDVIIYDDPPVSIGCSLNKCLANVSSKYMLHWQDDWVASRSIDLDLCIKIMEENEDVNQICFNKRKTFFKKYKWEKEEVIKSGVTLTTDPHFTFIPAIWRMSFIERYLHEPINSLNYVWEINDAMKGNRKMPPNAQWVIENTGTYFFGPRGNRAYVKHIGHNNSMRLR